MGSGPITLERFYSNPYDVDEIILSIVPIWHFEGFQVFKFKNSWIKFTSTLILYLKYPILY